MQITMELTKIAEVLKYTKPSKIAKPNGYAHRLEMWESVVLEFSEYLPENIVTESFLELCGFYE